MITIIQIPDQAIFPVPSDIDQQVPVVFNRFRNSAFHYPVIKRGKEHPHILSAMHAPYIFLNDFKPVFQQLTNNQDLTPYFSALIQDQGNASTQKSILIKIYQLTMILLFT